MHGFEFCLDNQGAYAQNMISNDNLICLPVIRDEGLDSKLSKHFGRAPYHLLVDTKTGETELLIKLLTGQARTQCHAKGQGLGAGGGVSFEPSTQSDHEKCQPVEPLLERKVSAVLCQGVGRGAYEKMKRYGISVWITKADTAGEALQDWRDGKLLPVLESQLCSGKHH